MDPPQMVASRLIFRLPQPKCGPMLGPSSEPQESIPTPIQGPEVQLGLWKQTNADGFFKHMAPRVG